jgi:hypothetical protein
VPGKHLTTVVRHFNSRQRLGLRQPSAALILGLSYFLGLALDLRAQGTNSKIAEPKFLGSQSCSASSCHGGAGEKSKQYTIWSTHDFHHARPYATLETARSERLSEVLKIGNPAQSARCTVCHAPFATVPTERLGHDVAVTEGVSCENCHGPAENWIRSHTRSDYTHADRVASGMRDLQNLYVRANTCVACHQTLDPEIRAAGHPELIFELDGQSVTMPKHWREQNAGSQIWYIGQVVAAREMSWQLANHTSPDQELVERWAGLVWVLGSQEKPTVNLTSPSHEDFQQAKEGCDRLAQQFASGKSFIDSTKAVAWLANGAASFEDKNISQLQQARRAERLVLALDRLLPEVRGARGNAAVTQSLDKLFADAQSLPDFNPIQFANDLNTFHSSVAGFLEKK